MKPKTAFLANNRVLTLAEGDGATWVEIIRVGDWTESYKQFVVEQSNLEDFVSNFEANVLRFPKDKNELPLNYSHETWDEAAGWIQSLEIRGDALWGLVAWTPKARQAIRDGEWRYISAEISWSFEDDETKNKYSNVLTGAALTNIPFVRSMKAVEASSAQEKPDFNSFTPKNMDLLKTMLTALQSKDKVSKAEFSLLKTAMTALSEEEQKEVETQISDIEEKVEEEKTPPEETNASQSKFAEELAKANTEKAELAKRIETLEKDARKKDEEIRLDRLLKQGKMIPANMESSLELLLSLDKPQADKVFASWEAMPAVVNFEEIGSGKDIEELSSEEVSKQISDYSLELQKQGVPVSEAVGRAVAKFSK
jgi:phage I-like protein